MRTGIKMETEMCVFGMKCVFVEFHPAKIRDRLGLPIRAGSLNETLREEFRRAGDVGHQIDTRLGNVGDR